MLRMSGIDEASGMLAEHLLGEMPMQESVGDIQLVHRPGMGNGKLKNSLNHAQFDNRSKGAREVHNGAPAEATHYPTSLIALKRTIRACLVAEHPLVTHEVGMGRPLNRMPYAVALQGIKLLLHRRKPVQVAKGRASGGRNG